MSTTFSKSDQVCTYPNFCTQCDSKIVHNLYVSCARINVQKLAKFPNIFGQFRDYFIRQTITYIVLKGSVHLIQYMWKWILKHQPRGIMTGHGSSCVLMILLLHLTCKQFLKWGRRATKQKNYQVCLLLLYCLLGQTL